MTEKVATESPKPDIIKPPDIPQRVIYCGLVWPEKGYPAYFCTIGEVPPSRDKTMDTGANPLQIYQEGAAKSPQELHELLKDLPKRYCRDIFTLNDVRYMPYIGSFNKWKRDNGFDFHLRLAPITNFEAGILKIKEVIKDKRLIFPDNSLIRTQLSMFSKADLEHETEFYAVRALSLVIGVFDKRKRPEVAEIVPKLKAWW